MDYERWITTEADGCRVEDEGVPQSEDYTISPAGPLGSRYSVGIVDGCHLGTFSSWDEAELAIREDAGSGWFPAVWNISDHGNAEMADWEW